MCKIKQYCKSLLFSSIDHFMLSLFDNRPIKYIVIWNVLYNWIIISFLFFFSKPYFLIIKMLFCNISYEIFMLSGIPQISSKLQKPRKIKVKVLLYNLFIILFYSDNLSFRAKKTSNISSITSHYIIHYYIVSWII